VCFSTPSVKPPPPLAPPPPPAPTATVVEPAGGKKKRRAPSDLEGLRIPLNPTGLPPAPRVGL